jgi:hypothetical protein
MEWDLKISAAIQNRQIETVSALIFTKSFANQFLLCETPIPETTLPTFPRLIRPTPLVYAIGCNAPTIVKCLLSLGADPTKTVASWHPIHYAASIRSFAILNLILVSAPSEVNSMTDQEITPLHIAAAWDDIPSLVLLCKYGADVDAVNKSGGTAMAMAGRSETRDILAVFGARVGEQEGQKSGRKKENGERTNVTKAQIFEKYLGGAMAVDLDPVPMAESEVMALLTDIAGG